MTPHIGASRRRHAQIAAELLVVFAGAVAIPGVFGPDPTLLAAAALVASLGFVVGDLAKHGIAGITPITLYAVGSAVTAAANILGLLAADGENRSLYFIYAAPDHIELAMELALAGAVLPVLGYHIVGKYGLFGEIWTLLPKVRGDIGSRKLLSVGAALGVLTILLRWINFNPALGTLTALYYLLPSLTAFVLVRTGISRRDERMVWLGMLIALLESGRAFAFAYLRSDVLIPLFAVVVGAVVGGRSVRPLRRPAFYPTYIVAGAFVVYFGAFAEARQTTGGGMERIEAMRGLVEYEEELFQPRQTLGSRLTSFNQLSRVGELTRTHGLYNGSTLEYMTYAFVPRFLWPEKPTIAKGAWFALEIGQARVLPNGRISNSVNMTVQGELYLNFGWLGVFVGCLIFGAFLGVLWSRAGFWRSDDNTLGAMFGFYLLWTAFGMGADLQITVTLIAVYLVFVAASVLLRLSARTSRVRGNALALGAR